MFAFLEFPVSMQSAQSALDDWVQMESGHVQVGREGDGERAGGLPGGSCHVTQQLCHSLNTYLRISPAALFKYPRYTQLLTSGGQQLTSV